jgi:hypothetical protein
MIRKEGPPLVSDEITEAFLKAVKDCPEFSEAVGIVKRNARGSIWLIGGFVYRSIVEELYGTPLTPDVDFDFIVESPAQEFTLPPNWEVAINSYGNPKFRGPNFEIDLIPLKQIHSITRRGIEPTIENFLSGTPLTVQAIAFDVTNNRVIGEIGISAIKEKRVGVNNLAQTNHSARLKGKSVEELVKDVADSLRFQAEL